jgi:hypothetical protein
MQLKRTKSFIIDFLIILIAFFIINSIFPNSNEIKELKAKQNDVIEKYTMHEINFPTYIKDYSIVVYKLDKEQFVVNIIYLAFMLGYTILLPFLWKGRTIGSYLNGIQVERFDKGYLYIHQLLIRNILVFGLGYIILKNILVFIVPSKYYFITISSIGIIQIVLAVFSACMILFTKNKRGLQDLISNTEMAKIM